MFARLVKLGDYTDETEQVPEPGMLLGLGAAAAGLFAKARRQQDNKVVANV